MNDTVSKTRLYAIYSGMKQRCYNPKNQHYKWYGAKGITLCEEWMGENGVSRFMEWALSNGYEEHLSIDRIDSDGPYSPQNCRWVTSAENVSRAHMKPAKSTVKRIIDTGCKYAGITKTELARRLGWSPSLLNNRINVGKFTLEEWDKIGEALGANAEMIFAFPDGKKIKDDTADMSVAEKVRLIMGRKKMTMGELAEATGQTRQNLSNKMTRGNFTEADIEKLANALGCTVEITFRLPNGDKV